MTKPRYFHFLTVSTTIILLLYPSLLFAVRGGVNIAFLLLLLLAFTTWIIRPSELATSQWQTIWMPYIVAMLALPVATLVSQLVNHQYAGQPHDAPARYWLAIPVFFLLQRLPLKTFVSLNWAFPLAALLGWAMSKPIVDGRYGLPFMDVIHFGDIALLFGTLALFSLHRTDHRWERAFKALGFMVGCASSIASGTRGGWLTIPVFIGIFLLLNPLPRRKSLPVLALLLIIIGVASIQSAYIQSRVNELKQGFQQYREDRRDTSIGIRWQLYQAASAIYLEHPLFGVGVRGFAQEMSQLEANQKISPYAAGLGKGEVHNDLLSKAVALGSFGLCALLAVYLVPLRLFWRATRLSAEQRHYGILGIVFVSGCFVFGLTVEFLNLTLATAFYSLTVAILLAACYNQHHPSSPEGHPHV